MEKNRLTIGQMSKLYNIPVKTLRYYDEIGLFKPYVVDDRTGYRYYRVEQFQILDTIWFLKSMGIPLKDIIKRVEHSTVEEFIHILKEYKLINQEKVEELSRIDRHLTSKINELEIATNQIRVSQPFIEKIPERKTISFQGEFKDLVNIEQVLRKVKKKIQHVTPVMIGKVGRVVSLQAVQQDEELTFTGIFVLVEDDQGIQDERITTLEGGWYATQYIREMSLKNTSLLHNLLDYIEIEGYEPRGPFLFRRIVDPFITHKEEEHLSQLQILVKPRNK